MTIKAWATFSRQVTCNRYFVVCSLMLVIAGVVLSNMFFVGAGRYTPSQIFYVMAHPTHIPFAANEIHHGLSYDDYRAISEGIWAMIATITAASGLAVAGLATQALTKNPLADASTLGFMQGGILALLVALAFGWSAYYLKIIAIIIGIVLAALLLMAIVLFGKGRTSVSKVILAGLAIGIVFKTFSFLVRHGDKFLNSVSFNYTLGGAEAVNASIGDNQWLTFYISLALTLFGILLFILIAKPLTILELGDEQARQLGVMVRLVKGMTIMVVVITVPAAIVLVGNLAFIGLFASHLARFFFRTRNYLAIAFPAIMIGIIISLTGLLLTTFLPRINSGIWMTIVGAPYIVYIGIRGLR